MEPPARLTKLNAVLDKALGASLQTLDLSRHLPQWLVDSDGSTLEVHQANFKAYYKNNVQCEFDLITAAPFPSCVPFVSSSHILVVSV